MAFAKGGDFSRFYADCDLVFDWTDDGAEYKQIVASKYGSATRFVKSEEDYFKKGITWVQTTVLGINARLLSADGIFGVASPTLFPHQDGNLFALLGILNSVVFDALARCLATRNWGATAIGTIPVPSFEPATRESIERPAKSIYGAKASWDEGNEICTRFHIPWLLRGALIDQGFGVSVRLDQLAEYETREEAHIQQLYTELNDEVYKLYGIPDKTRVIIEETLGDRPPEVLWPQMESKSVEQKRMEHVFRLLSYVVKRVVEADEDGVVPFTSVADEPSLLERVHTELAALFPDQDVNQVEVEITNELKKNVKGYRKTNSIREWLENVFFEYHVSLYKNRPIVWHIASNQGTAAFAFGALVHYHKFHTRTAWPSYGRSMYATLLNTSGVRPALQTRLGEK